MATQIQLRRDTEADWNTANPTLAEGEVGLILDADEKIVGAKVGNGASAWIALEMHLPLLSGVANALEDAGGETESGTPVNNVADNHTFLLKGLSAQLSKVLGVADSAGNVKFSVDKDGKTTLNGGVSGNLDLLTGALQIAGNTSMQIMQIQSATYDTTVGTNIIIQDDGDKVIGMSVTITPQSTSSKIILVANALMQSNTGSTAYTSTGSASYIVVGNTSAQGVVHNGTIVDGSYHSSLTAAGGDTSQYMYRTENWFLVLSPSTTSALRYDITCRHSYGGDGGTTAYATALYSQFYAIEIL